MVPDAHVHAAAFLAAGNDEEHVGSQAAELVLHHRAGGLADRNQ